MSSKEDRCLTRSYFLGSTGVIITLPHPGTSFLEQKNLKAISKICLKAVVVSSVSITVSSSKERRFWTTLPLHSQGPKTKWGKWFSKREFWASGHDELIWLHVHFFNLQNSAASLHLTPALAITTPLQVLPVAEEAETYLQSYFWKPDFSRFSPSLEGRRVILAQGQSAASSWAYISKAFLTIKGNWCPLEQVGGSE